MPSTQIYDGEWIKSGSFTHHECCGCGLVHAVDYKLQDGELFERWNTDPVETRKARRAMKKA